MVTVLEFDTSTPPLPTTSSTLNQLLRCSMTSSLPFYGYTMICYELEESHHLSTILPTLNCIKTLTYTTRQSWNANCGFGIGLHIDLNKDWIVKLDKGWPHGHEASRKVMCIKCVDEFVECWRSFDGWRISQWLYDCEAGSESSHSAVTLGLAPLGSPWGLTGSLHMANSLGGWFPHAYAYIKGFVKSRVSFLMFTIAPTKSSPMVR
jgi:hypothetical protein